MNRKTHSLQASDIMLKPVRRSFSVRGQDMAIVVEEARFAATQDEPEGRLLDQALVEQMMRGIVAAVTHNASRYNPVPKQIVLSRTGPLGGDSIETAEPVKDTAPDNPANGKQRETTAGNGPPEHAAAGSIIEAYTPRWTLEDVSLGEAARSHIETALAMIRHREKLFEEWGLKETLQSSRAAVLNFYGPPGTGKSMTAEALAGTLAKPVLLVNYAELESKYVGDTPKNIRAAFQAAARHDAVLVFDEADSFLGKRLTRIEQSSDYGVNMTRSVMLMELERFDGVVVFTTNLLQNYDDAFRRRILAQVAFMYPNEYERADIWTKLLPSQLPRSPLVTPAKLAAAYDHVTGADIKDMVLYASALCLQQGGGEVDLDHFDQAFRYVASRYVDG